MSWTNAWDETKPADTDLANTLGTQGRQVKLDIRERLDAQHIFGHSTTTDGEHRNIVISSNGIVANQEAVKVSSFSLTGANGQSLVDLAGTWNTSGTPTGIKLNLLDTASNAASLLLDLQVGGVSKFKVRKDGAITGGGGTQKRNVLTKVAGYNMVAGDDVVLSNGTFTVRLESAVTVGAGTVCDVKNIGTGVITITSNGGTIDGAASQSLAVQYQSYTFLSDGTNWYII